MNTNCDQFKTAELIRLCEKKMGVSARLPRRLKKIVKINMRYLNINFAHLNDSQDIFMREDGSVFIINVK